MADNLFLCPDCGGPHFNITQFSSDKGGIIICVNTFFDAEENQKFGCGWKGEIPAKDKQ